MRPQENHDRPSRSTRKLASVAASTVVAAWFLATTATAQEHQHREAGPAVPPNYSPQAVAKEPTVFDLGLKVMRSDGQEIDLSALKGRPTILTMFFASCPDVCPLMTEQIRQAEEAVPPGERDGLQVALVSFDQRDQPEVLRAYRQAHAIDSPRWTIAVASENASDILARSLGVRFEKLPNGSFNHSAMVGLIGADGTLLARVPASSLDEPRFVAAVRAMIEMSKSPSHKETP